MCAPCAHFGQTYRIQNWRRTRLDRDNDQTPPILNSVRLSPLVAANVASGEEALAVAEARTPDLAILDLMRPGLDAEQARGRLVHETIRQAGLLTFVEKALASTEPVEQDLEATGPDKHGLHVHGTVLHDGQQRKIGALIVLHDVTRLDAIIGDLLTLSRLERGLSRHQACRDRRNGATTFPNISWRSATSPLPSVGVSPAKYRPPWARIRPISC